MVAAVAAGTLDGGHGQPSATRSRSEERSECGSTHVQQDRVLVPAHAHHRASHNVDDRAPRNGCRRPARRRPAPAPVGCAYLACCASTQVSAPHPPHSIVVSDCCPGRGRRRPIQGDRLRLLGLLRRALRPKSHPARQPHPLYAPQPAALGLATPTQFLLVIQSLLPPWVDPP